MKYSTKNNNHLHLLLMIILSLSSCGLKKPLKDPQPPKKVEMGHDCCS